ncbi:ABC transporter substrate-binding protein [Streptomyces sp. V4I2]|uniref:ABC transporter substrate-binding protein n=1 Tax=Streptomyces sp. V4I2 TaxID=3042280 RepID=UPI0027860C0F|nr:ABC transporter substrate-binding protein [Streptomyces sp. V4I2]MDQ1042251.1 polar amino acid transport system substrate-binding protein [Streptomyces sp. V4I2]
MNIPRHRSPRTTYGYLAMASAGTFLLAACGSGGSTSAAPAESSEKLDVDPAAAKLLPADIKKAGVLRVATDATYPPFEYFDTDNKTIIGADADFAQALGDVLGVKVTLTNVSFDGLIPTLDSGKADLAAAGMADKEERRKLITFVDYARNDPAFLLKPGDTSIKTFADLCGKNVAVQSATSMADNLVTQSKLCTDKGEKPVAIKEYKGQDQAILAVQSGRAVAAVSTGGSGAYLVDQAEGQLEIVIPPDELSEDVPLGLAVPKADTELVRAVHAAMARLIDDGTYARIMKKWGLTKCCSYTEKTVDNAKF